MTGRPVPDTDETPIPHLRFGLMSAAAGILTILTASIDPWLLVLTVGVVVSALALYDRSDPDWYTL